MQQLRYVLFLAAGFLVGWFTHSLTVEEPDERTGRRISLDDGYRKPAVAVVPEPAEEPPVVVETPRAPETVEVATPEIEAEQGEKEQDPIEKMIRSQSAMWVGFAKMQAKGKLKGLLAELGFDEETAAEIEEAILAEVTRQTELAIQMMLGEAEMDLDAFAYFMGLPPDLSPELAGELGTFLSDDEIESVRSEVQKAYKEQLTAMADMQIGMMQIQDLSTDQRTRMRELFSTDVMKDQMGMFAEVTRDRSKFSRLVSDPDALTEVMHKNLAPTRARVRDILNDEQFKKYEAYEQTIINQMQMGLKMMGSLAQPPKKETPKPDGP